MRQHGFTTSEVVTSLGIVGILTAVLLPCLSQARARSEQTQEADCVSNLKALDLAFLMYAEEWDRHTVLGYSKAKKPWNQNLEPYVRDSHVFECPSIKVPPSQSYDKTGSVVGYGLNECLCSGIDLDAVQLPAQLITMGDDAEDLTKAKGWYYVMSWDTKKDTNHCPPADRHSGGANVAFSDGHVKWFAYGDIGYRDGQRHQAPPGVDYWHPVFVNTPQ
jgi:prepilin-type processing-associated H-X9-DG protein